MSETTTSSESIPDYVLTTYIRATAEEVWRALTDPDLTASFWGHAQVSKWEIGSRVDHIRTDESGIIDVSGRVIEADPPHRLAFGFDAPEHFDDPAFEPSVVAFQIDENHRIVRLTVTHSGLSTEEERRACGHGWPAVLANLKTLLETGEVLPTAPWEFHAEERAAQMGERE
ncbi:MAG: SRPBCC domain-containing protein [Leucobacter sp.]